MKEDFKTNTMVSDKVIIVKKGDKAFLDSKGLIHITTGKAQGKIVKINDVEAKGYDHANIAKSIFNRLNLMYGLEMYLDDEEYKEFVEEIENVLMDIL